MLACPYCGMEINEQYNFCTNCEKQIKCVVCQAALLPNKSRCLVCGVVVVPQDTGAPAVNEYSFEEKQTQKSSSRTIKLRLTDRAIESASPLFSGQLPLSRPPLNTFRGSQNADPPPQIQQALPLLIGASSEEQTLSMPSGNDDMPQTDSPVLSANEEGESALHYFEPDGELLVVKEGDYKGKSKKSQQERFIVMYVWAYERIYKKPMPSYKEHLVDAAKRASLYDPNLIRYFTTISKSALVQVTGGFKLNTAGQKQVESITAEMYDDSIKGDPYWEISTKPPIKRSRMGREDTQRVQEWIAVESRAADFDVRKLKGVAQAAMFALWCITKDLNAAHAVKPGIAFLYLCGRYKTVSFDQKEFTRALGRSYNADKFAKTKDGDYYLTRAAEGTVESWLNGSEPVTETEQPESNEDGIDEEQ